MPLRGIVISRAALPALFFSLLLFSMIALAQSASEMHVDKNSGDVKIRQQDQWQTPKPGSTVNLPAIVSTGTDGAISLSQGATVLSIAANTAVELLAGVVPGQPLQRAVQDRGSAFYDIDSRDARKFRVETPYLVAVVKGTRFNVTVAGESATVALYEGLLRIETPDGSDVVELREGQIAKRHRDDSDITVIAMDDGETPVVGPATGASVTADGELLDETFDTGLQSTDEVGGTHADADFDAGLDLDESSIDLGLDSGADLGDASADLSLGTGADLNEGEVDLGLDADADLGDAGLDADLDASADLDEGEVDLGLDADADLGDTSLDTGVDAGTDLDSGELDASLDSELDLADTSADTELDASADLEEADVELDSSTEIGDTSVDLGLDADLDDAELDAELDADLGLLDGSEEDTGTETEDETLLSDPGDLLRL